MTTASLAPAPSARPLPSTPHRSRLTQLRVDAAYLLLSWPLMLVAFVVVVVLLALGAGSAIVWVGLPILVAGAYAARGAANVQRRLAAALEGREEPASPYLPVAEGASPITKLLHPLRDTQTWLDVVWVVVGFFVATLTWCVALTWLVGALCTVAGPIAVLALERTLGPEHNGLAELLGLPFPTLFDVVIDVVAGLAFAITAPAVLRAMAALQTGFGDALLSSGARHRARADHLAESRDAVRRAETDALRRLERDIHDGPQQRLIRLNMDLARARRHAAQDPARAESLISDAMAQTQETLAELRQLSRGIAPPVLVDRGLEAAVSEAAARSLVPATVYANVPTLPAHVETAAYFVVSEALANLNKHSGASHAEVTLGVQDGLLFATVTDDGVGGADAARGHGLAGLVERLRGVDGRLTITSPQGGPTVVEAVIPCGS